MPLGISPNTMFSEGREDARTGARLGLDESQFVRSQEGLDRRFNIGEANESSRADKAEASRSQKATGSLRKEYESLDSVKRYQTVLPIVSGIANAPDTPAGDLAVVYGAAKVLDPDSAVKEGEFDTVLKSKSPMQTVLGGVRFATTGRGRLTPESREKVKAMLMNQANQYRAAYNRDYERYSGYAIDQGVESEKVVGTRIDSAFTDRRIQTMENEQEYNALPSGATYIGPGLHCNLPLRPAEKAQVLERLPPRIAELYERFCTCEGCGRVFWQGSHWDRMRGWLRRTVPGLSG